MVMRKKKDENVVPQIVCSECGGIEFTKSGQNNSRVISTEPRVVIKVQRWICSNPNCRKYNFSTMDGKPIEKNKDTKK